MTGFDGIAAGERSLDGLLYRTHFACCHSWPRRPRQQEVRGDVLIVVSRITTSRLRRDGSVAEDFTLRHALVGERHAISHVTDDCFDDEWTGSILATRVGVKPLL
jgi:hypothetical protein